MRFATVLLVAFACSGAFASEPGQPLDCSDWVFLQPRLSCTSIIPRGSCLPSRIVACNVGESSAVDNESHLLTLEYGQGANCGVMGAGSVELVRYVGNVREVVGYLAGRCVSPIRVDDVEFSVPTLGSGGFSFDAAGGRVLLSIATLCRDTAPHSCPADYDGDGNPDSQYDIFSKQVMAITGFATMFDILQTYTPQPASLGFRVPYMPEGMAGADHFDTYWGTLAKPLDFTQAHSLQCGYPAAAPHVGDYLTVADTVPAPAPGQGVYYVTAATYQGATRYGRKTSNGHLSGRDPAVLPGCGP